MAYRYTRVEVGVAPDSSMASPDSRKSRPRGFFSQASAKLDHRADALAAGEGGEAVVDFLEPDSPRDELVQLHAPLEILVRDQHGCPSAEFLRLRWA